MSGFAITVFIIPFLVYTYFWVNPNALSTFLEGLYRYIAEIYFGYKAWRLEYETKRAYKYFQKRSKRMAKENGFSENLVKAYFETYREHDWKYLYQLQKEEFEERNRDIEEQIRDNLLF